MERKADKLLRKMHIKDYTNSLEKVLERKYFSIDTKNLLLSMLYKIENSYKDYSKTKVEVTEKADFLEKIIEIIEQKCNEIITKNDNVDVDTEFKVDKENGNFDYLMGCDVDLNNVDVVEELTNWGKWYLQTTNVDGFRMDAVKHIRASFFEDWLEELREFSSKPLFTVGEYWSNNLEALQNYLKTTNNALSLFDVPLHYNLFNACHSNGTYDMRTIFNNTLVAENPNSAVTFVDNHDTEPGQALQSWIDDWFKPLAYSLILLRKDGLPCVFYGDYYGIPAKNVSAKKDWLEKLILARKNFAYGSQIDYFNDPHIIGWVRTGDRDRENSGMVVIMTNSDGGCLQMNVGKNLANSVFYDYTGNMKESVYVDQEGNGIFYVNGGSVSVWVKQNLE